MIGRTDDMLIYKGMNVFPGAIRDVVVSGFGTQVAPHLRVWQEQPGQVRFDDPIAVDVEAAMALDEAAAATLARALETRVREVLQVRVRVRVLQPGGLPRGAYKNALLAVRGGVGS